MTAVLTVVELAGVFAFAVSGAVLAVRRDLDLVGVIVLAQVTALGGGLARDLVIGRHPPAAFTEPGYGLTALAAALVVLAVPGAVQRCTNAVLGLDAVGLGLFSVAGALVSLEHGASPAASVVLGVVTAAGGGVLRDLLAGESPSVLRQDCEIYAVPAALAAAVVVVAVGLGLAGPATVVTGAALGCAMRLLALRFRWRLPGARAVGGAPSLPGARACSPTTPPWDWQRSTRR